MLKDGNETGRYGKECHLHCAIVGDGYVDGLPAVVRGVPLGALFRDEARDLVDLMNGHDHQRRDILRPFEQYDGTNPAAAGRNYTLKGFEQHLSGSIARIFARPSRGALF